MTPRARELPVAIDADRQPRSVELPTFAETRELHQAAFAKTSPAQRIEWLGQMLELMEMAAAARQTGRPERKW